MTASPAAGDGVHSDRLDSDRLAAAKLWLISEPSARAPSGGGAPSSGAGAGARRTGGGRPPPADLPYLAHALYALVPVACPRTATMSADERWRLYVNPGWLAAADVPEIAAGLLHCLWHLLADHADRARGVEVAAATAGCWQRAADATIAHTLTESGIDCGLPGAEELGLPPGRSAEEYYAVLSRLPAGAGAGGGEASRPAEPTRLPVCGSGCDGLPRTHELPAGADLGGVEEYDAAQVRRTVAIAYREHCAARGTEPGRLGRWAARILAPRVDWRPLLASAVRRGAGWAAGHTVYTYRRRSRRQCAVPDVVLPGTRRPLPRVAMVVDTSGSVDDTLLGRALGEVDGALRGLGVADASVTVLACDAAVHHVTRVRRARDVRLAGGGGTDLRVGLAAAADLRPRPDLVVVLTDGHTPWPVTPPPGAAVIAAVLGRHRGRLPATPEWVTRVECVDDD